MQNEHEVQNHNYSDGWDVMICEKWLLEFANKMVGWSNSTI